MPLFHTAGCVMSVLGAVVTRATLILPPYFDPGLMFELIAAERPETLLGVQTMLIGMLDHPGFVTTDVSSIRQLLTGGAVVPPALVSRVEAAFGAPLSIVFGQTEASPLITQTSPQDTGASVVGGPVVLTPVRRSPVCWGFSCCCGFGVWAVHRPGGQPLPAGELAPPAGVRAQCVSCRHRPCPGGRGRPGWKRGGGC